MHVLLINHRHNIPFSILKLPEYYFAHQSAKNNQITLKSAKTSKLNARNIRIQASNK